MNSERPAWEQLERQAPLVGAVCLAACAVGAWASPGLFLRSYLVAYCYWLGITLGSLAIVMVQHLTGGGWGLLIRRILESAAGTLPVLTVLFAPIVLSLVISDRLYPWTDPAAVTDPILSHKRLYLNVSAFIGRAIAYFVIWGGLVYLLNRGSRRQEASDDPRLSVRLRMVSGPGLVLYGLSVTFAAIDWVMSLQPHWFSTIFAVIFAVAQALAALAFAIAVLSRLATQPALAELATPGRLRDLGNLLLMLVMLWTYTAFSQFLLTWAGNLPAEIVWYLPRTSSGWQWLAAGLLLGQFALPFLLLLFRDVKDRLRHLAWVARLILATCFLNLFWQIVPAFPPADLGGHGVDFLAALLALFGIGGIWLGWFLRHLRQLPLVPRQDSGLREFATHG